VLWSVLCQLVPLHILRTNLFTTLLAGYKDVHSFIVLQIDPLMPESHCAFIALDVFSAMKPLHVVFIAVGWHFISTLVANLGVDLLNFIDDWLGPVHSHVLGQQKL